VDAKDPVRRLSGKGLTVPLIQAVLFEPVGCLAEFAAADFETAAREVFADAGSPDGAGAASGSQAYWQLMAQIEPGYAGLAADVALRLEELEIAAVNRAELYEDVSPSLAKLRGFEVGAYLVSSLSRAAVARFIERFALADLVSGAVAREDAGGVMARPLRHAIERASLDPARAIYLVDNAIALDIGKGQGINTLLMINDYDEGRVLADLSPTGGVVSLAELVDALHLIEQRSSLQHGTTRLKHAPFELFDPG
jgi:beta-phosphoglucomutase-like phosphatase (HAD superfamily)